jgi:hypothetical protein
VDILGTGGEVGERKARQAQFSERNRILEVGLTREERAREEACSSGQSHEIRDNRKERLKNEASHDDFMPATDKRILMWTSAGSRNTVLIIGTTCTKA